MFLEELWGMEKQGKNAGIWWNQLSDGSRVYSVHLYVPKFDSSVRANIKIHCVSLSDAEKLYDTLNGDVICDMEFFPVP